MGEVWKKLRFTNDYEVSNWGRVRSLDRIILRGDVKQPRRGQVLKPGRNKKTGYYHLVIKGKSYYVHRLVAEHFVPNPDNLPEVNHKNTDKGDNQARNLEWMTSSQNKEHAVKNGVLFNPRPRGGENAGPSKLTWEIVRLMRNNPNKLTQKELAKMFGVTQANVSEIVRNRTWKEGLTIPKVEGV